MAFTTGEFVALNDVGQAIAYWMAKQPTVDYVICKPASKLADVLGDMIARRIDQIAVTEVSKGTLEHLSEALAVTGAVRGEQTTQPVAKESE
jgi:hypothetical protein